MNEPQPVELNAAPEPKTWKFDIIDWYALAGMALLCEYFLLALFDCR